MAAGGRKGAETGHSNTPGRAAAQRGGESRLGRLTRTTRTSSRRTSGGPAYLLIADVLSDRIASGVYRSGDQLPTEAQLREEFAVSPMTVRRAVNVLLDRGLVSTTQGRGTFVRTIDLSGATFTFEESAGDWLADSSVEVTLLEARIRPAEADVAATLSVEEGAPTVLLRRLLARQGTPLAYQLEWVVYDELRPLVEAQLQITALEGLLQAAGGVGFPHGRLTVQAVTLDAEVAALLADSPGAPALRLEHLFEDFDGRPVSWGWFVCRAGRFQLSALLGAAKLSHSGRAG